MAVASSTVTSRVQSNLERIHVLSYFDHVIGGDQIVHGKPAPDIFLKALELLEVGPDEALVLEDSKNGILASYQARIPVICIPDIVKHTQETLNKTYKVLERLDQVIDEVRCI